MNKSANGGVCLRLGRNQEEETSSGKGGQKNDNTFHGVFCPSGEIRTGDRYLAGLPLRHLPFSKFLTFSTVSSHLNLVDLFHSTSAHRIRMGLQSVPRSTSRDTSRCPLLSCRYARVGMDTTSLNPRTDPKDQKTPYGIPRIIRPRIC